MLAKLSGFNPKGQYVSLEKEKQNFCVVLTYSIKREHESRKFHVVVVQQQLRNVQKSVIFFANLKHITTVFCCLPSLLQNSPRNFATMVT